MIRKLLAGSALLFTLVAASALSAQDWATAKLDKSPRHGEWVKVASGGRQVNCFVVYPEVKNKAPAVLLIHEIYGLSDWARDEADQVAAAGYIAIAPDLLSGLAPGGGGTAEMANQSTVMKAVSGLNPDQVTADLNAAADYIEGQPSCNGTLFVVGFCWGGNQSFRFATNRSDLKAAFVFYGTLPKTTEEIARIACPVYGFYAGNDARVSATVPATIDIMQKAGKTYDGVVYDGAGHGFMRTGEDPQGSDANKKAHDEAWTRWRELLKKHSS
jgi:carboxymethylenebutenolidase